MLRGQPFQQGEGLAQGRTAAGIAGGVKGFRQALKVSRLKVRVTGDVRQILDEPGVEVAGLFVLGDGVGGAVALEVQVAEVGVALGQVEADLAVVGGLRERVLVDRDGLLEDGLGLAGAVEVDEDAAVVGGGAGEVDGVLGAVREVLGQP